MVWPFERKPAPPPRDWRIWNEDWKVGDVAECIAEPSDWVPDWKPWQILSKGDRLTITGFSETAATASDRKYLVYVLHFAETKWIYPTQAFRKVRPVSAEKSEIVERILKAKPGKDRVREDV